MLSIIINRMVWRLCFLVLAVAMLTACPQTQEDNSVPAIIEQAVLEQSRPVEKQIFDERASQTGLIFQHYSGASGQYHMPEILGSGVALFDYDNDGDLDVYLVQGSDLDQSSKLFPLPENQPLGPRLFTNQWVPSGELRFVDTTAAANLEDYFYGMGVATSDYDNDGDVDLYVVAYGENRLYQNNQGKFKRVNSMVSGEPNEWGSSASFCDVNRDQLPDIYVANYIGFSPSQKQTCRDSLSQEDYCSPDSYKGAVDKLYLNQGAGRFNEAGGSWRVNLVAGTGLGVLCRDLDQDGFNDLYVANDSMRNLLWINQSGEYFENLADEQGAAININGLPEGSMGVTASDIDFDGDDDLFMTHWNNETNTLYRNDTGLGFMDVTTGLNLAASSLSHTGFGTGFIDYDNDGDQDLFIVNGAVQRYVDKSGNLSSNYGQKNQLLSNDEGRRFVDVSGQAGAGMLLEETGRGAAFGDIDNDGDVDVVVSNKDGPARLYVNQVGQSANWLGLHFVGVTAQRDAQGAVVTLTLEDGRNIRKVVRWDGSYQSAHDPRIIVGLTQSTVSPIVEIRWPDGSTQTLSNLTINQYHKILQAE